MQVATAPAPALRRQTQTSRQMPAGGRTDAACDPLFVARDHRLPVRQATSSQAEAPQSTAAAQEKGHATCIAWPVRANRCASVQMKVFSSTSTPAPVLE